MGRAIVVGGPERILIVEDDPTLNYLFEEILRGAGHVTSCAFSLAEARILLATELHGCLLLDLNLADGSAEELLRRLAQECGPPPCVLISATPAAADVADRYGIGFLRKPFDVDAVLETVARAMRDNLYPRITDGENSGNDNAG